MKIQKIILLAVALLPFASCSDFLEENPKNTRSSKDFFQSSNDAFSLVNRMYKSGFPEFYNHGVWTGCSMNEGGYASGLFDNPYKGQEIQIVHMQNLVLDPVVDNNYLEDKWRKCYETIVRRCNYAINGIPNCPGLTDAERNQLLGEAKFFRALNYFYLVKTFGAVPIITKTYESLDDLYVRRNTEQKVYEFIIQDLIDAMDCDLADKPQPENGFRISKGSVEALLADVYLNMAGYPIKDESKYQLALETAKRLIESTNYALMTNDDFGENSAYSKLRTSENEKEYLYCVEYNLDVYSGGSRPMQCFPNSAASWAEFKWSDCNPSYMPEKFLLSLYDDEDDLRFQEHQYFHRSYQQTKGDKILREFGQPYPYIWFEEEGALNTGVSVKDQVHYRLAEVYLMAAEASVKANKRVTAEAINYLATIMDRASISKDKGQIIAELTARNLTVEQFCEEVWKEKIREFIFEFKVWKDITRTRMYPTDDGTGHVKFVNLIGAKNPYGHIFTEDNIYFPICYQETSRNPQILESPE